MRVCRCVADGVYMPSELQLGGVGEGGSEYRKNLPARSFQSRRLSSALASAHVGEVGLWDRGTEWLGVAQGYMSPDPQGSTGSLRTCVHLLCYKRGNQGGDAGGAQLNSRRAEPSELEWKQMSVPQHAVPGACTCITSIFKERFLSGSLQHSLTCQVQNLIPYAQLSLLYSSGEYLPLLKKSSRAW